SLLDGGIKRWVVEGHPIETGVQTYAPAEFIPQPRRERVVDAAAMERLRADREIHGGSALSPVRRASRGVRATRRLAGRARRVLLRQRGQCLPGALRPRASWVPGCPSVRGFLERLVQRAHASRSDRSRALTTSAGRRSSRVLI